MKTELTPTDAYLKMATQNNFYAMLKTIDQIPNNCDFYLSTQDSLNSIFMTRNDWFNYVDESKTRAETDANLMQSYLGILACNYLRFRELPLTKANLQLLANLSFQDFVQKCRDVEMPHKDHDTIEYKLYQHMFNDATYDGMQMIINQFNCESDAKQNELKRLAIKIFNQTIK